MKIALYIIDNFIETIDYNYPVKVGDNVKYCNNIFEIEKIVHDFNTNIVDVHLKLNK